METYKKYKKQGNFSHVQGIFPILELLTSRPEIVKRILLSESTKDSVGIKKIRKLAENLNIECIYADKQVSKLAHNKDNAVAIIKKYQSDLSSNRIHLVLVNPDYMGNLGTIIRTMSGFDVNNLAVIEPAADIFAPKTIRASMGAIFRINFELFDSIEAYTKKYSNKPLFVFLTDGDTVLAEAKFTENCSLIFGNEGAGLDETYKGIGKSVRIKHSNKVDSLNLALACGVSLYEVYNQIQR